MIELSFLKPNLAAASRIAPCSLSYSLMRFSRSVIAVYILEAFAQPQLGQGQAHSPTHQNGYAFLSVSAHIWSNFHLDDVYLAHQHLETDTPKVFDLCLASAPLINTQSFIRHSAELEKMAHVLRLGEAVVE